jgi:hypothetical protein
MSNGVVNSSWVTAQCLRREANQRTHNAVSSIHVKRYSVDILSVNAEKTELLCDRIAQPAADATDLDDIRGHAETQTQPTEAFVFTLLFVRF